MVYLFIYLHTLQQDSGSPVFLGDQFVGIVTYLRGENSRSSVVILRATHFRDYVNDIKTRSIYS